MRMTSIGPETSQARDPLRLRAGGQRAVYDDMDRRGAMSDTLYRIRDNWETLSTKCEVRDSVVENPSK